jgi:hypothetical protein
MRQVCCAPDAATPASMPGRRVRCLRPLTLRAPVTGHQQRAPFPFRVDTSAQLGGDRSRHRTHPRSARSHCPERAGSA